MNELVYASIILLAASIPLAAWARAWRLRKLAAMRLHLSRSVTQMERLMLDKSLTIGDACHDVVFDLMYSSQFRKDFVAPNPLAKPSVKQRALSRKVSEELLRGGDPLIKPVMEWTKAYYGAVLYNHPLRTISYVSRHILAAAWRRLRRLAFQQTTVRPNVEGAGQYRYTVVKQQTTFVYRVQVKLVAASSVTGDQSLSAGREEQLCAVG